MKKNTLLTLACCLLIAGCTDRFEALNTNPNQVSAEQMEAQNYRTGSKVLTLESLVVPVQEHIHQFAESLSGAPYGGYIGSSNTWAASFETFNPPTDWRKAPFATVITETYAPYRGIINGSDDQVANALALVLRVGIMQRVTDSYGPIPYTDAVNNESIHVGYDSQKTVYAAMFEELDKAIELFKANINLPSAAWSNYDKVYYGNISQWLKYANSLKLRMAMRISFVDPDTARAKASEAIAGGVILSNADNAAMHAVENRSALIYNDWGDSRVGADILAYMNGYKDPRVVKMFLPTAKDKTKFVGIRIGGTVAKKSEAVESYSNLIISKETPYLWLNAAEVSFLRAEYELRFGDKAAAKILYEQGIRLSFEERGAEGAETYIADATSTPERYVDPLGKYSATAAASDCKIAWDSTGDDEKNLEQIITQKWIAIFPLGIEAWSEYRRTGYPRLLPAVQNLGPDAVDLDKHARRLDYPIEEYNSNSANLDEAISTLNSESSNPQGDSMATRVWWDCR